MENSKRRRGLWLGCLAGVVVMVAASPCFAGAADSRALVAAIARHDFASAEKLILGGAQIDYVEGPDRETVLMTLSAIDDIKAVQFLLQHRANVNQRNSYGMTPVMYAAWKDRKEAIKALAAAGADLDVTARDGQSAVSVAKWEKHDEAARLLLSLGAKDVPPRPMY